MFDVGLLAARLLGATAWLKTETPAGALPVGYFGASTGGGAALWAAASGGDGVFAVVSRGGRPDLAGPRLGEVRSPTLLIVGGLDSVALDLNRQALAQLRADSRLEIVPGASHLFEEPGTLAVAANLARDWFRARLPQRFDAAEPVDETTAVEPLERGQRWGEGDPDTYTAGP